MGSYRQFARRANKWGNNIAEGRSGGEPDLGKKGGWGEEGIDGGKTCYVPNRHVKAAPGENTGRKKKGTGKIRQA